MTGYDLLLQLDPSPAGRLARAVAVAEASGPAAGLATLFEVELPGSHRVPAVRAELLARLGERAAALEAFDEALGLCQNVAETSHLERRRADVVGS